LLHWSLAQVFGALQPDAGQTEFCPGHLLRCVESQAWAARSPEASKLPRQVSTAWAHRPRWCAALGRAHARVVVTVKRRPAAGQPDAHALAQCATRSSLRVWLGAGAGPHCHARCRTQQGQCTGCCQKTHLLLDTCCLLLLPLAFAQELKAKPGQVLGRHIAMLVCTQHGQRARWCCALQVLGHAKTVTVLLVGWMYFGDQMPARKLAGMVLAVLGMVMYGATQGSCLAWPCSCAPSPSLCWACSCTMHTPCSCDATITLDGGQRCVHHPCATTWQHYDASHVVRGVDMCREVCMHPFAKEDLQSERQGLRVWLC
jgi:hypothetical protein